jgi:hypothetical protein
LLRAICAGQGKRAVFQVPQRSIQDRVIARSNCGRPGIEIDMADFLNTYVGHAAILIGKLESLIEESQNTAFGFRAVLELDHVRAGSKAENKPNANW